MDSPKALSEERRLEIIEQIKDHAAAAGHPDFDVEATLAGHLAGPASEDRPNVPVWEYRQYAEASGRTLEELTEVRFPMTFFGGGSTVTSIEEELRPGPVARSATPTAEDIVRRYEMMHAAGILGWTSGTRSIHHLKAMPEYMAVYRAWSDEVRHE